ncbi:MAG: hypothetical protein HQK59_14780 [Deltaproteobacteria bacterium]|nr:hypothetical protein [Deltaproteobacteria bacterium]MBF0524731.1 hypothetical protein [Deltaproteobacteria bacterium]
MRITIDIPDFENITTLDQSYLTEALAAVLYYNDRISEREACIITGTTRRGLEKMMQKFRLELPFDTP